MNIRAVCLLLAILAVSMATWVGPVKIRNSIRSTRVESIYRDPTTLTNHLVYYENVFGYVYYMGVADNGTVLKTAYLGRSHYMNGVIRGAGDGRRLFVALPINNESDYTIQFQLSENNGKNWTSSYIVKQDGDKYFQDMMYVPSVDKLFVFFSTSPKGELRVVTSSGSHIQFSEETLVAPKAIFGYSKAKAAYGLWQGKPCLHVAFQNANFFEVMCTSLTSPSSPPRPLS